jgi:hypothetical protein
MARTMKHQPVLLLDHLGRYEPRVRPQKQELVAYVSITEPLSRLALRVEFGTGFSKPDTGAHTTSLSN